MPSKLAERLVVDQMIKDLGANVSSTG